MDGTPLRWHDVHYGARAIGGAGLLVTEATNVSAQGRITHGCTGIYSDEHEARWKEIVEFAHAHSAASTRTSISMSSAVSSREAT